MSDTFERSYEQQLNEMMERERTREESERNSEVTERVMEATEAELELTMQRAQELSLTDQECMTELAQGYLQDALEMGIEQKMLAGLTEQLETKKQQRLEAYALLQTRLQQKAA
ncbi:MAG: hypothetical protein AAB400_04100 [Patescibacteria group bacterium]